MPLFAATCTVASVLVGLSLVLIELAGIHKSYLRFEILVLGNPYTLTNYKIVWRSVPYSLSQQDSYLQSTNFFHLWFLRFRNTIGLVIAWNYFQFGKPNFLNTVPRSSVPVYPLNVVSQNPVSSTSWGPQLFPELSSEPWISYLNITLWGWCV